MGIREVTGLVTDDPRNYPMLVRFDRWPNVLTVPGPSFLPKRVKYRIILTGVKSHHRMVHGDQPHHEVGHD